MVFAGMLGSSFKTTGGTPPSPPTLTLPDNLALRATFEDGEPVYINSNLSSMTVADSFVVSNTITPVQGLKSGYKQLTTSTFNVSNFIGSPWTISFWYYHNYPNTNTVWKTIMSTSNWAGTTGSWRMYFQATYNTFGIYQSGQPFQPTTVNLSDLYQKWTLIAFTSNSNQTTTIKVKTLDQTVDYEATFSALNLDASSTGVIMEFGDGDASTFSTSDTYYDDIRIYNIEMNSTQLESLWAEHNT